MVYRSYRLFAEPGYQMYYERLTHLIGIGPGKGQGQQKTEQRFC